MNAEFQRIARRDKETFLSDQCKEIEENNTMERTRDLFKKMRDTWGGRREEGSLKSLLQYHSLKASILWHSAFFMAQLSHPYMTTGKIMVCREEALVAESCLPLCAPMNCSPPGSSVHGVLQATILEWVAIPFSRGSS